jgi:hypothetical protein
MFGIARPSLKFYEDGKLVHRLNGLLSLNAVYLFNHLYSFPVYYACENITDTRVSKGISIEGFLIYSMLLYYIRMS